MTSSGIVAPTLSLVRASKRRHNIFHTNRFHHRHRQKIGLIIGTIILLHLLQRITPIYYLSQDQRALEEDPNLPLPLLRSVLFFVKADYLDSNNEADSHVGRNRETKRVDGLLRATSSSEVYGVSEARPLNFIKYPTRQRGGDLLFDAANLNHRHSHVDHCSHSSHQRHRYRSQSPPVIDPGKREERSHHHRQRSKRNNDGPLFYEGGAADRPVVATKKGLVKGITQKIFTGKFVDAFLGIPFAKPPIGKYRFRHPQPINPWPGEFDASRMPNSCYQINDTFFGALFGGTSIWNANTPLDENCLQLNIWTPFGVANTTISSTNNNGFSRSSQIGNSYGTGGVKRPVLVWIFGGGFYSGTSTLNLYEGGALASEEDIIVVSINYRVAALGFLYFGRPDAPGNSGLFDQLLALQWINENIDQFGGDPKRVTIFGESAGAVSVAYHLLSPLSRDLFHQAILQSGAATNPWGSMETHDIIANGLQLAAALNCPSNQSDLDAVIECLLRADPMALVSQEVGQLRSIINFPFVPVVDGSFLLESPIESLSKSNFKQAPILLGSNNDEGTSYLIYMSEFSRCPSTSGNDEDHVASSTAPSIDPIKSSQTSSNQRGLDASDAHKEYGTAPNEDMENLDLIRPEHQTVTNFDQNQVMTASHIESGHPLQSKNHTLLRSAASTQKQQQQLVYNQNESKPCKPNENLSLTRDGFLQVLSEDINPYAEHPIGKKAIVFEYSNWNNPYDSVSNFDGLDKIVGDYYFTCHVNEFAYRYAQAGNPVFMYYFKQRSSVSPWPKWMGVLHGDEISYVFGEPLNPIFNHTQKEIELSRRMMKYWANFAKYGNPTKNGENTTMPEKWPEYADRRQYFELHGDYIRVGRGPRSKQCAFWSHYLPQLIQSYDKNNQCQTTGGLIRNHPFPPDYRPRERPNHSLLTSIPSFALFSFIVIVLIVALVGSFAYVSKRASWKLNFWPNMRTGRSASPTPDDEGDGDQSRTGRHNNSSNA